MSTQTRDSNHNHLQRESMTGFLTVYKSIMINCLFFYFNHVLYFYFHLFKVSIPSLTTPFSNSPSSNHAHQSPDFTLVKLTSCKSYSFTCSNPSKHTCSNPSKHTCSNPSKHTCSNPSKHTCSNPSKHTCSNPSKHIHSMLNPSPLHQTSPQPFTSDESPALYIRRVPSPLNQTN